MARIWEPDDMVCQCYGVTAGQIQQAVKDGANTLEDMIAANRAGAYCGACIRTIVNLIEKYKAEAE